MAVTIKLKNASGSDPSASDLVVGEVAIRTDNGKLFTKKDNGSVAEITGGGGIDDGDKGDITVSNSGGTFTIDNDVVTFAKMQNIAQNSILARLDSGSGDIQELSAGQIRGIINVENGATADQSASEILTLLKTVDGSGSGLDADTLDGVSSASFLRSDADDSFSGTITGTSDATNPVIKIQGQGPNFVQFASDSSGTVDADSINLIYRTTPNTLAFERASDDQVMFSVDADDQQAIFAGNLDVGAGLDVTGNIVSTAHITGVSDSSDAAFIAKGDGTNTGTSGYLQLNCSLNSHGIKLSSPPHSAAATYTFTFPTDIQSGKYLSVDSNGQTSWGTPTDNNFTDALLSKLNGIAASATNVTNNNQLTNGAGYITATLTNEQVQDIVGNMVSSNTESGITVTYQDSDGTLDFSVASQTDENFTTTLKNKLDGIAANATNVTNNNQLTNGAGYITSAALSGAGDGGNAALLDGIDSTQFVRADQDDTLTGNLTLSSGSQDVINFSASSSNDSRGIAFNSRTALSADHNDGYLRLNAASEFSNGVYTPLVMRADGGFNVDGNTVITGSGTIPYSKLTGTPTIPTNNNQLTNGAGYITSASDGTKLPLSGGELSGDLITHNVRPDGNNSRNLGSTSNRWANVYVNDMHLSNKGKSNDVDGSWGDWTIQEGKTSLFIINNRNGKKYSINLTEVS